MTDLTKRIAQAKTDGTFIQTSRLFLMPLDISDANDAFKWCGDEEVTKFLRYTTYTNADDVAKWIAESGHNCFGIFLRDNGQLIGCGDSSKTKSGVFELGYNLAKAYWGNGYGTEASQAMLAYRVAQGVTDFVCEHAVDNMRSGRVIQKCGFTNPKDSSYTCFDGIRTFNSLKYTLHIDRCELNVDGQWFDKIVNGSKTIELRLYDEKRRSIKVGDYIVLNNLATKPDITKCVAQVTKLHKFANFDELYQSLDMTKCGYAQNEIPNPDDMLAYYSAERQAQWGVVGIEFQLLCVM